MGLSQALNHKNVFKGMVNAMVLMLGVFGLSSHYYSAARDRYYPSKLMFLYETLATLTFSFVYLKEIYNDWLYDELDLTNVTKLYAYMNILSSILCFFTGLALKIRMPIFMNRTEISKRVDTLGMSKEMVVRPITMVMLRAMLTPVVIEVVLIVQQWRNEPERSLLWTFYKLFPMITSQIMPNCVFGAFELGRVYLVAINAQLRDMKREVNAMQTEEQLKMQKPYYRMKRFCELADKLDGFAEKFAPICVEVVEYLNMYGVPFICALLCNFGGLVVGFYLQYVAAANTIINDKPFDAYNSLTNAIFFIISFGEVALLATAANDLFTITRETGLILQDINLKYVDIRFKQSVEAFSLISYINTFKIKPLGLLEIDISLIHNVCGALASFLLILIQSDLAQRFSTK